MSVKNLGIISGTSIVMWSIMIVGTVGFIHVFDGHAVLTVTASAILVLAMVFGGSALLNYLSIRLEKHANQATNDDVLRTMGLAPLKKMDKSNYSQEIQIAFTEMFTFFEMFIGSIEDLIAVSNKIIDSEEEPEDFLFKELERTIETTDYLAKEFAITKKDLVDSHVDELSDNDIIDIMALSEALEKATNIYRQEVANPEL